MVRFVISWKTVTLYIPQLPLSLLIAAQNKPMVQHPCRAVRGSVTNSTAVDRIEERRDTERSFGQLRQLYEHYPAGGIPDERVRGPVLETERVLCTRKLGQFL